MKTFLVSLAFAAVALISFKVGERSGFFLGKISTLTHCNTIKRRSQIRNIRKEATSFAREMRGY